MPKKLIGQDKRKYAPPFSLRVTLEQRARLDEEAGRQSIGQYIRTRLFGTAARPARAHRRPLRDDKALGEVLAALGRSRLTSNLHQIAKRLNRDNEPISPELEQALLQACSDLHEMRQSLMRGLGRLPDEDRPPGGDLPTGGDPA